MRNIHTSIHRGFTLAEVLITLGIIGVVAAMTIPALISSTNDNELRAALKKEVSVISQAAMQMAADNGGTLQGLFVYNVDNTTPFVKYLSAVNICNGNIDTKGCWHFNGKWLRSDGTTPYLSDYTAFYASNSGIVLKDGTLVLVGNGGSSTCTGAWVGFENGGTRNWVSGQPADCEVVFVDVNGFKGPNRISKDIFALSIREPGIVYPGVYAEPYNNNVGCAGKFMRGETCP